MAFQLSNKMNTFQTGIFNELADYKHEKTKQGIDLIDLSVGSPDQAPPKFIIDVLLENVKDETKYGYALSGVDEFNNGVVGYYKQRYNVELNPQDEVLQLMGSQDGLVHLPMVIANEGDTILVPDPGYTAYEAGVKAAGAQMFTMPLLKENSFLPDLDAIPTDVANKAKMMILNFPGNPVPALADIAFFEKVVSFAKKNNILVVHDLAYGELVFDGKKAISLLQIQGAKDIGIEFNSLSKSFNMAGCRIGYLVGNSSIINALGMLKSNLDYGVFLPVQYAATAALRDGFAFLDENKRLYERRRNILVDGLNNCGWKVDSPKGSMFLWADIPSGWTSKEFTFSLMDKARVIVVPGNAFGKHGEGYVRIALVQPENKLIEAVKRIDQSRIFG